jgi:hypothetical protein
MSERMITPQEAALLFHRWVTEAMPILALFDSADKTVRAKVTGYVYSFTRDEGLFICNESPASKAPPKLSEAYLRIPDPIIAASTFEYQDETEVPEGDYGSGMRVHLPNGDSLIIAERRT